MKTNSNSKKRLVPLALTVMVMLVTMTFCLISSAGTSLPSLLKTNSNTQLPSLTDHIAPLDDRAITWEEQMNFSETGGKTDYVYFGEATDANDGKPADSYDVAKPPAPMPPYIRAYLKDGLDPPYTNLWKDFRHYPSLKKTWNLSVVWYPLDEESSTSLTISWSTSKLNTTQCEYDKFVLSDSSYNVLVADMRTTSSYTYTATAITPKTFKINCTVDTKPPQIINHSPSSGETGDAFTFNASVFDDLTPKSALTVKVNWAHGSLFGNDTMTSMGGNYFVKTITLDNYSTSPLTYHFYAKDNPKVPNTNYTSELSATITDDELPVITDVTAGTPTTGDSYTFSATVTDNIGVVTAYVEYWYGSGSHTNVSMVSGGGNSYSKLITVSDTTEILYYIIRAVDARPNWQATSTLNRGAVLDNDLPVITDVTAGTPTTGDSYTFSATVTDNIGVVTAYVEYWYGSGSHTNVSMVSGGGNSYSKLITVSDTTEILYYIIRAVDARPNWQATSTLNRGAVLDNDLPVITDVTAGTPTTGDSYTFSATVTDNIGVVTAYVEYWYGSGSHTNVSMVSGGGNSYSKLITVSDTTEILYYIIRAVDARPNWQATSTLNRGAVLDNDLPVITDVTAGTPTTGDSYTFSATVTDNIGVVTAYVEYWYGSGSHTNVSMVSGGGNSYSKLITVSDTTEILYYIIRAVDARPNWQATSTLNRGAVLDNDLPVITDVTAGTPTTGDSYTFSATVTDNIGVVTAYVEYWYGSGSHTNVSMVSGGGNSYSKLITVSDTTEILYYIIRAVDARPNWQATSTLNRGAVLDNDLPVITDVTAGTPTTGDSYTFSATVTDNIGVVTAYVEYWYGSGSHTNVSMVSGGGNSYSKLITVSDTTEILYYIIRAVDARPNWQATSTLNRGAVLDNDLPVITDVTAGTPTTGDSYTFSATVTDNIGVVTAYVEYWYGSGSHTNVSMVSGGGNSYSKLITVSDTTEILYYIIRAVDARPNWQATSTLNRGAVLDNDAPVITSIGATPQSQLINGYVKLKATVTDNINVNTVKVDITGPAGFTPVNTSMTLESGNNYIYNQSYSIVGSYNYYIWTKDTSNNGIKSSLYQFEIFAELQITALKTGWNFISTPFNLTVTKTNLYIMSAGTRYTWGHAVTDGIIVNAIYNWTTSKNEYNMTNTLTPGEGYWLYAYSDCELWATNLTPMITNDFITPLKQNWNVVGVPIGISVNKADLIINYSGTNYTWAQAVENGYVVKDIFGWSRTVPQGYIMADTLDPGYCYWIYAYVECTLYA